MTDAAATIGPAKPDPVPGGNAHSPWHMPGAAWKDVLVRTWTQAGTDNISLAAAGVAFYGFTAMVPMLGAIVLIYGMVADAATVVADVGKLTQVMPHDGAKLIGDQLLNIVHGSSGKKGFALALAIGIALFGARSGAAAVVTGLNIAYEEKEERSFLRLLGLTFAITGAMIGVAIVAMIAIAALGHLPDLVPNAPRVLLLLGKLVSYLALVVVGAGGAATLYRYGPDRAKARWVWITPGSVIASAVWLVLTGAFGFYVADFGSYDATYGSLGAVIVFLTWLYLTSYVLLLGAELNAEMERQTKVDTTEGPPKPIGQRGSAVADRVVTPETRRAVAEDDRPTAAVTVVAPGPAPNPLATRAPLLLGLLRAGPLATMLAMTGLSALRRGRRTKLGVGLLGAGALVALLRRDEDAG